MVRPGAAVLDVGITRTDAGLAGDVAPEVAEVAGYLAPMPGGVGPMTRAMLLANVVDAAEQRDSTGKLLASNIGQRPPGSRRGARRRHRGTAPRGRPVAAFGSLDRARTRAPGAKRTGAGGRPPVMNIVVCVKQVPDTWVERTLRAEDSTAGPRLGRRGHQRARRVRDRGRAPPGRGARGRGDHPVHGPGEGQRVDPQGAVHGRRQGGAPGRRRARRVRRAGHLAGAGHRARAGSGSTWSSSARSPPTPGWA